MSIATVCVWAEYRNQNSEPRIRQGHNYPKTDVVVEEVGIVPVAVRAPRAPLIEEPGTAPQHGRAPRLGIVAPVFGIVRVIAVQGSGPFSQVTRHVR